MKLLDLIKEKKRLQKLFDEKIAAGLDIIEVKQQVAQLPEFIAILELLDTDKSLDDYLNEHEINGIITNIVTSNTTIETLTLLLHSIDRLEVDNKARWDLRTRLAASHGCDYTQLKNKIANFCKPAEAKPAVKNAICLLEEGYTAKQLANMHFDPINWIVKTIVPSGLTLLCGKPKIGKSWLSLDMTLSIPQGDKVAGYFESAKQVNTLYLSLEDHYRRLKTRINLTHENLHIPDNAFFYTKCPRLDEGGLDAIKAAVEKHSPELVIIDTLAKIRPAAKRNQQNYDADYEALSGLKNLADKKDIAIIVVHHLRKMASDDPIDLVSGTLGLTGAADTILILQRDNRVSRTNTTFFASGRDIPDKELAMKLNDQCVWEVLGDAEKYRGGDVKQDIIGALEKSAFAVSPAQIANTCKKDIQQIKNLLPQLIREGLVARAGHGLYQLGEVYFQQEEPF